MTLLWSILIVSSVQALSWAYPFVVWNGRVYEVKLEETGEDNKIGKMIGEVKTKPDEMTGEYYESIKSLFERNKLLRNKRYINIFSDCFEEHNQ